MKKELWKDCLNCKNNCCKWDNSFPFPVFITPEEISKIRESGFDTSKFSESHPCTFLKDAKCSIYPIRPIDCQLFPFDVHIISGEFYWILWEFPCTIVNKTNKEEYLAFFEKSIVPSFKKHLKEYSEFRCEELTKNYDFEILREIKIID